MRKLKHILTLILLFIVTVNSVAQGKTKDIRSVYAKQKALFMYGFTKYVQWSEAEEFKHFTIGVLGNDAYLSDELKKIAESRTFFNKPIVINNYYRLSNLSQCQMLYVDDLSGYDIEEVLNAIGSNPTLLVSEGYAYKSTMISFVLVNDNINYMINSSRLKKNKLYYTSDLVRLSTSLDEWQKNYASVVDNLINTKQLSQVQQTEIQKLLDKQKAQQKAINQSLAELKEQQAKINAQKEKLKSLVMLNEGQRNKLKNQIAALNIKDREVELKTQELIEQELNVMHQNEILNRQIRQIKQQEGRIKEQRRDISNNETKIKSQNTKLNISFTVLFVIAVLAVVAIWSYRQKQLANLALEQKNIAIESQKNQIEQKNIAITSSINYAKRIQEAILPREKEVKGIFKSSFVYTNPKDIVSGDFFWIHQSKGTEKVVFAVADCTGHGVPGAFMSIIGFTLLNEIVIQNKHQDSSLILNRLRKGIVDALHQKGDDSEAKDGMDIALCVYDPKTKQIDFSGARNSIYHVREGELTEYKGDPLGIGFEKGMNRTFKQQSFKVQEGDMLYLSTDGFADQRGGFRNKKYYYKPYREFLTSLSNASPLVQKKKIDEEFNSWKGDNYQIDDICIVGIKFDA